MSARARVELQAARAGGYALGSFNAVNVESAEAIVAAAEDVAAPVILAFSHNAARYAGLETLAAVGVELRRRARVPVLLHFDHATNVDAGRAAIRLGFDIVMLEVEDRGPAGVVRTRQLSDEAHASGVLLEVEADIVAKGSRAPSARAEPAAVAAFVAATAADLVAVRLGTVHKQLEKTATLDLEHLAAVVAATPAYPTLHGASGVPPDELRRAVAAGLVKVNVGTELMVDFTRAVRESLADPRVYDVRAYLGAGRDAMRARVRTLIGVLGGAGRAAG